MKNNLYTSFATLICCCVLSSSALTIDAVRAKYAPGCTIAADVAVSTSSPMRQSQERRTGRIRLAPGDRFRVEIDNTVWVCDGTVLWQYGKGANQVIIKNLADADLAMHPSRIFQTFLAGRTYAATQETARETLLRWDGDTLAAASQYRSIAIRVRTADTVVSTITVTDRQRNQSVYSFTNVRFGAAAPEKTFTFTAPAGARVLDSRE